MRPTFAPWSRSFVTSTKHTGRKEIAKSVDLCFDGGEIDGRATSSGTRAAAPTAWAKVIDQTRCIGVMPAPRPAVGERGAALGHAYLRQACGIGEFRRRGARIR